MKLYCLPVSDSCRPVMLLAAEEGIAMEMEVLDLLAGDQFSERFVAINPNSAVPVLEDGDFRLTEASAILKYLADRVSSAAYPRELRARARVHEQMDWFVTGFHRVFGHGIAWPRAMPERYGWPDPAMQDAALRRAEPQARRYFDVLDRHWLAGDGPFLGGARPSLADMLGVSYVSLASLVEFDLSPWPRVLRWLDAMRARPSWSLANAAFDAWCEEMRAARRRKAAA